MGLRIILLIIIVCLALFAIWQRKNPYNAVMDMVTGMVDDDPTVLAGLAGVQDVNIYSLARVAQSEEGLSSDRAKIAVMYATINHANATGKDITAVVTAGSKKRSDYAEANGHYGRQGVHPYCSTIAEPTEHTIDLAKAVYDGTVADETDGAQWWDNPHKQDVLAAAHPKQADGTGYYTAEEIAARRTAKRARLVNIPGISTRFWA